MFWRTFSDTTFIVQIGETARECRQLIQISAEGRVLWAWSGLPIALMPFIADGI